VLRALLGMRLPHVRATQFAAVVGQAIAFVVGFFGLFFNPMLLFIALFVYLGAAQEAAVAQVRGFTERLPVSAAVMKDLRVLPAGAVLSDAVDALLETAQHEFPVIDASGDFTGVLTRDDLIAGLRAHGPTAPVTQFMRTAVPEISSNAPFPFAFELMQQSRSPIVVVRGEGGRVVGFLTAENLGELVLVHSALSERKLRS
jgi:CBS domain-containing protein